MNVFTSGTVLDLWNLQLSGFHQVWFSSIVLVWLGWVLASILWFYLLYFSFCFCFNFLCFFFPGGFWFDVLVCYLVGLWFGVGVLHVNDFTVTWAWTSLSLPSLAISLFPLHIFFTSRPHISELWTFHLTGLWAGFWVSDLMVGVLFKCSLGFSHF